MNPDANALARWRWRSPGAGLLLCLLGAVLTALAFDLAYAEHRRVASASTDTLIYYNMLLDAWRRGSPLRGHTLLPSPYFIDMGLEAIPAFLAADFEVFAYDLALIYSALLFAAASVLVSATLNWSIGKSAIAGALSIFVYFAGAPPSVNAHAFMQSHTSEVFCGLSTVAFLAWWAPRPRPAPRARRWPFVAYLVFMVVNVASSPFFISTYVAPALAAALLVSVAGLVPWRRGLAFAGGTIAATAAGLMTDSTIATYAWPIRGDSYGTGAAEGWRAFVLVLKGCMLPFVPVMVVGILGGAGVAALVLCVRARRRATRPEVEPAAGEARSVAARWAFVLSFASVSLLTCTAMPIFRGAFASPYELRYLQEPVFLTCIALATGAVWGAEVVLRHLSRAACFLPARSAAPLRLVPSALAALAMPVALSRMHGPFGMSDDASVTAPMVRCFLDADRSAGLHAGVATSVPARYLNAARLGAAWRPGTEPIVEMVQWHPPSVSASENNQLWLRRSGPAAIFDFIATEGFSSESLALFRARIGVPSRVVTCPILEGFDEKRRFDLWIYDDPSAQTKLRDMVLNDTMTAPFAPWSPHQRVAVSTAWGIHAPDGGGALDDREQLVWHRERGKPAFAAARTSPMFLPSGDYAVELRSGFDGPTGSEPVLAAIQSGHELARATLSRNEATVLGFTTYNRGGATSGEPFSLVVYAGQAESVTIERLTIEQLHPAAPDPLRLFR